MSIFDETFDVVVVGSGHAGYAAALAARRHVDHVLLIGERGDLLWESGRSFCPRAGSVEGSEDWDALLTRVAERGGWAADWLDGAITETVGTSEVIAAGLSMLYYAVPVAVESDGDRVVSLRLATKSGPRTVTGRRWIDATERGTLARLVDPALRRRDPSSAEAYLYFQHADWASIDDHGPLGTTAWATERFRVVEIDLAAENWRSAILRALSDLDHELGAAVSSITMSHGSFEPLPRYTARDGAQQIDSPADNIALAAPALSTGDVATLADRFRLGVAAAEMIMKRPASDPAPADRSVPIIEPVATVTCDVCVVGAGTGGAVAAWAAGLAGARVTCVEAAGFVGGIGTGGGIHTYSFGVPGGLQAELDRRTRALMAQFGKGPLGDGPFNPWAKMITLEQTLRDHGVDLRWATMLLQVHTDNGTVSGIDVAGPDGVVRIEAAAFVDGTGDGDLSALAGADFTFGREHDGLPHAYSQSSGRLHEVAGRPRMSVVNFDAGFCDPTDPEDLTRARLTGIAQYLLPSYSNLGRPTYLAPAIGLRQGRQIVTDYVLTLDDQISHRRFPDAIGYTASHYENHAPDYEFETDEAMFWSWANRQWTTPIGCELSYRILVPRGLTNVWIASRCAGVSQDAHHATRMQRDMQRIGEAAGYCAAIAVRHGDGTVPYEELRTWLDSTAALDRKPRRVDPGFGRIGEAVPQLADLPDGAARDRALHLLDSGTPGEGMWWLYRHRDVVEHEVIGRLESATPDDSMMTWLAAGVVAMWHNPRAEPRLLEALAGKEYGFGPGDDWTPGGYNAPKAGAGIDPLAWTYVVPNWLCALGMLRLCGTSRCLPVVEELLAEPRHGLNTLTTAALTVAELARRGRVSPDDFATIERILRRIETTPMIGAVDNPRRRVGRHSELAVRGMVDDVDTAAGPASPRDHAVEDNSWQVPYAVASCRKVIGEPQNGIIKTYLDDGRVLVRRAFGDLL